MQFNDLLTLVDMHTSTVDPVSPFISLPLIPYSTFIRFHFVMFR